MAATREGSGASRFGVTVMNVRVGHRAIDVAKYILEYCVDKLIDRSVTQLKLIKLTYLAHGWVLGATGDPLVCDEAEAWPYGPVFRTLYDATKQFGSKAVTHVEGARQIKLDERHQTIIDSVCQHYGEWTASELSWLTHKSGSPWHQVYDGSDTNKVISDDVIEDYYHKKVQLGARQARRNRVRYQSSVDQPASLAVAAG